MLNVEDRSINPGIKEKMARSSAAFGRLYKEHGVEVSWAKHSPSTLTEKFVAAVLTNYHGSGLPLVYDVGCGEGGKAFYIAQFGINVLGFDARPEAIKVANQQAAQLGLQEQVSFIEGDLSELDSLFLGPAMGVHDYQCINHIPREYHDLIARGINRLLVPGGIFLTNSFNHKTTDFYGEDISHRFNGEFIFNFNPNNVHHQGKESLDGMYCYFYTEDDLLKLYSPYFVIDQLIEVPHPFLRGRFLWEMLMIKKEDFK